MPWAGAIHPIRFAAAGFVSVTASAWAQAPERTIDEIKTEAQGQAERGNYPLIGLDPADVRDPLAGIHSRDPDEWAANWGRVADKYMDDAKASSDPKQKDADYARAWRLYYFGNWPVASSPSKAQSYQKSLNACAFHAAMLDPPIQTVRIPFAGSQITGYLRLRKTPAAPCR